MQEDLLRSVSRSFYLSLRFLPAPMREPVSLAYLLARYSDTLADAPGLPESERLASLDDLQRVVSGEIDRLAGDSAAFADCLSHPGERELASRADELVASFHDLAPGLRALVADVVLTILQGQRWDLAAFATGPAACATADDLLLYTYRVAGCVGEFWTKTAFAVLGEGFADPDKTPMMLDRGRKLGHALQLVNILRDLHEDLPRGRCYLPADELRAAGWNGEGLPSPSHIGPVFGRWLGLCRSLLEEADAYTGAVRAPRVRFCTRLPKQLAEKTAQLLDEAGAERVLRERIKIPRSAVWRSVLWTALC